MATEHEEFEQLRKLLALKRHEQPPPGYFDQLAQRIQTRIETEEPAPETWFGRFIEGLRFKPALVFAYGGAVCALLVAGVVLSERMTQDGEVAKPVNPVPATEGFAGAPAGDQALKIASTNQQGPPGFLFAPPSVNQPGLKTQPVDYQKP